MNSNTSVALTLFFIITFSGLGYFYYNNIEFENVTKDIGFTKQARKNSFLLSQLFLETGGHNVSTVNDIKSLPIAYDSDTHVVISTIANPITLQKEIHKLELWIKKGGTYIISMNDNDLDAGAMSEDHFANYFDIELTNKIQPESLVSSNLYIDCENPESKTPLFDEISKVEIFDKLDEFVNPRYKPTYTVIKNHDTSFNTLYPSDNDLTTYYDDYAAIIYAGDYAQYYLLKYTLGKGEIWFNFTNEIFNNEFFSCGDHAKLLDHLVDGKKNIVYLSNINYTSFINILLTYAKEALILSSILFLLICWFFMKHLYQYRSPISNSAPKFSQHILAISHLIKRENSTAQQVNLLINHINEKVKLILVKYTHEEFVNFIKVKTTLDKESIEFALSNNTKNIQNTTKQIILLQTIRKTL
ncbi:MAG: hypothetical protein HRU38_09355 [Saccharospirillaceae bacterium]|nr:hypothetical protein [Pseudomonadales bacterium]NRB78860.1 hypothetical protein [Saccharospirillaceae bacterium]